ncbi:NAD(P)-binding domain-containing protein [Micromonospora sp. NPDC049101]|uniref:NAD(P)-binding domain-containing protein n=1 Tax=unclassified Micromonospora TaxID=2617518 RepID=UPI0033DAE07F
MNARLEDLPVVVIGAGPVGLAAAAHLYERGIPFALLEAGDGPAAAVRQWGHVRLFSPWRYNIDRAAGRLLDSAGWVEPEPDDLPTGAQLAEAYLQPLAELPALRPSVRYGTQVVAVTRLNLDRVSSSRRESTPFLVRLSDGEDMLARAVVDASGTWGMPNTLGASGIPAHGEAAARSLLEHALPDVLGSAIDRFTGAHTLVVGSGHSAANTLLALADLAGMSEGTTVTWAIRAARPDRLYGSGESDPLPARGALATRLREHVETGRIRLVTGFSVQTLVPSAGGGVSVFDGVRRLVVDRIVAATGFRPDHTIASELRLDLDPILGSPRALAPLIDPNAHTCDTVAPHGVNELTHSEPGYYAVGVKSYGRAPTFLLTTGYEQARSVVAALAGDWDAARESQLNLPEAGVCTSSTEDVDVATSGCAAPASGQSATGFPGRRLTGHRTLIELVDESPAGTGQSDICSC